MSKVEMAALLDNADGLHLARARRKPTLVQFR